MTVTQATILGATISSPLLYSLFEFGSDRLRALFRYRGWQAIFLDQGQVYFGKITSLSKNDLVLTDIYYLKENEGGVPQVKLPSSFTLVKLGEEIHGPKDRMTISRSHITFTESLKNDAKVIEAITDHKLEKRVENIRLIDTDS